MFWITFFRGFIFGQNAKGRGAYKRKKGGDSWEDFIYYCGHVALTETRGGLSQNSRAETVEGAKRCKRKPLLRTRSFDREIFWTFMYKD